MATIKEIQLRLTVLGFPCTADGAMGPQTRAAVRAFQTKVGLEADGIPGPQTQAHLFPVEPIPERDIDPPQALPPQAKPVWPRQAEVERFYGAPGKNQTTLVLPFKMVLDWEDERVEVGKFSIHEKVHDSAKRAFDRIADAYDATARARLGLDRFGGCLNVRAMRGGSRLSMHSWGIAIDFAPGSNALKWGRDRATLARPECETFWRIWEGEGWVSLGRLKNFDWMHVQAARL